MGKGNASKFLAGLITGAAISGAAIATTKIVKEIKNDITEVEFASSDNKNSIKVAYGSSSFAKELTMFKIVASSEDKDDECKFVFFAKGREVFYEWKDDEHFEMTVGSGKYRHFCTADFSEVKIVLAYSLKKADEDEDQLDEENDVNANDTEEGEII